MTDERISITGAGTLELGKMPEFEANTEELRRCQYAYIAGFARAAPTLDDVFEGPSNYHRWRTILLELCDEYYAAIKGERPKDD